MIDRTSIFISGTDTNIGKTVASALLVKILDADYWKPIQCGDLDKSDRSSVKTLLGPSYTGTLHPERYALSLPQSPHIAARAENVHIKRTDFVLPKSTRPIVVEGAGGCLAPLNDEDAVIDLAAHLGLAVVLVTRYYLGAYNHTLLSIEAVQRRGIKILGLILNGEDNPGFRDFISRKTNLEFLGILAQMAQCDSSSIETLAHTWREKTHDRIVRKRSELHLASLHSA